MLTQSVVSRSLLEAADPRLLVRLLTPHHDCCARHDLPLTGDAVGDPAWLRRLHAMLCAPDSVPETLTQALLEIQLMAGEWGHDRLLDAARQQTLTGLSVEASLHTIDLALRTYLEHPEVFWAGYRASTADNERRLLEYVARSDAPMQTGSDALRDELRDALSEWFQHRRRSGFCELDIIEHPQEVQIHIIHGQTERSRGVIEDGARRQRCFRPDQHDLAVYNRQTHRLCLQARYPSEVEQYRRLIGRVFFDDDDHFLCEEIFSVEPIQRHGARVLTCEDIPQLRRVSLREVHARAVGADRVRIQKSTDLSEFLEEEEGRAFLATHDVFRLKLALYTEVRPRAFAVTINPPNRSAFERRLAGPIILDFLVQRGFLSMGRGPHQLALPLYRREQSP